MKFYTSIPKSLKPYYEAEQANYSKAYSNGDLQNAWKYLDRLHD